MLKNTNTHNEAKRSKILNKIYDLVNTKMSKNFQPQPIDTKATTPFTSYTQHYKPLNQDLDIVFAQELTNIGGKFIYCETEKTCFIQLQTLIHNAGWHNVFCKEALLLNKMQKYGLTITPNSDLSHSDVSITTCDMLIARTGSIVVSTMGAGDRTSSVFSRNHVCIAYHHQLVEDIGHALHSYKKMHHQTDDINPSFFSLITGPSKTADIEKTLVTGVHGPEDIFVFLIDE